MLTDSFDFYSKDVVLNKKLFYNYIKVNNGALIPEYTQIASDTFGGASFFSERVFLLWLISAIFGEKIMYLLTP